MSNSWRYDTCPWCGEQKAKESTECMACYKSPSYTDEELRQVAARVDERLPYALAFREKEAMLVVVLK